MNECKAFDLRADTDPYCVSDSPPDYCHKKWCFVNSSACERPSELSIAFVGLSYSYSTCGNVAKYVAPADKSWQNDRPLYVFSFGLQEGDELSRSEMFTGMFTQFAWEVLREVNVNIESIRYRQSITNETRRQIEGTYSGCVHDIALGHLDICLGDFWDTTERQSFASPAFVSIGSEDMYLLAHIVATERTFLESLAKPFAAFGWDCWLLILGVIFATSLAMVLFEFHRKDGDYRSGTLRSNVWKSFYMSAHGFVSAASNFAAVTPSGRIMSLGYGFFILLSIASFTAETASFLISENMNSDFYDNLDDVIAAKQRVCYPLAMQSLVEAAYPALVALGVKTDSASGPDFAEHVLNGICAYAIVGETWLDSYHEAGEYCGLQIRGSPILSFPVGYWVKEDLRTMFGWGVARQRSLGSWAKIQQQFSVQSVCTAKTSGARRLKWDVRAPRREGRRDGAHLKQSRINAVSPAFPRRLSEEQQEGDVPVEGMSAVHMLGACCIVALTFFVGLIWRCVELTCYGLDDGDAELTQLTELEIAKFERYVRNAAHHVHFHHKKSVDIDQGEHRKDDASQGIGFIPDDTSVTVHM
eukprot:TRINITY_DN22645_c0_g1_i3.p1 TRINITY_DN22645_c0_g1~~TRINITY_DN22645_c0_g1_i3.p1  ORF type:complete len:683 (+),score=65.36 TRINITY_DN22645_c0_g1_i3:294-2051(+)